MKKNRLIAACAIAVALSSSVVLADETLDLKLGDKEGTFHCKMTGYGYLSTADVHTDGVEVDGFCKGQPGVNREGHANLTLYTLSKYYFKYKKSPARDGSISIVTARDGMLICEEGPGGRSSKYGNGKYC